MGLHPTEIGSAWRDDLSRIIGCFRPEDVAVGEVGMDLYWDKTFRDEQMQALEVQALLARQGIKVQRRVDGTKSTLFLENYTQSEKDQALLAVVRSGIVDQHIGLEIFDNGDFTSTKEDKRIRLARAINGELARLIRKIDSINNAQVFISIPEQTLFANKQNP